MKVFFFQDRDFATPRGRNRCVRLSFVVALLVVLCARRVIIPVEVRGISMSPTYSDGRLLLASPVPYWFGKPQRGDIILLGSREEAHVCLKRVLGLPGERVAMQEGQLVVNGREVEEPHVPLTETWQWPEVRLDEKEYLVAGDNREIPAALQCWGRITEDDIRARVLRQAQRPRQRSKTSLRCHRICGTFPG